MTCNERLGDASEACIHCAVDYPMVWPKIHCFFEVAQCMDTPGDVLATKVESMLSADLITAILTADKVALPSELMGMYWSAVDDLFACGVVSEDGMSGQGSV